MDFGISRFLVSAPLLAGLAPADRDAAIALFRPRPFGDGEPLLAPGVPLPGIFVILDGGAELWLRDGARRVCVGLLGPGDIVVSPTTFLPDLPCGTDVVGTGTGMGALLPSEAWRALVAAEHPAVVALEVAIIRTFCQHLQLTLDHAGRAAAGAPELDVPTRLRHAREDL